MIPLLDLGEANAPFQAEIEEAVLRVARSGRYVLGPEVERFEHEWAQYCGTKYCVGTANALEAMQLALVAMGIGPGDEVIVPANTYIATGLAVTHCGATPVPAEPSEGTFNINPAEVLRLIGPRTRAILPVHLYGRCANVPALNEVAERHGLFILEDAAQAHGASYGDKKAGSLGHAGAWSFYPSKNLGAIGDAGALTTNDRGLADKVRRLRNYGGVGRLDHQCIGINSRLDEIQAAVICAKLPFLDYLNGARRYRADTYRRLLAESDLVLPSDHPGAVYHQFVVRSDVRSELLRHSLVNGLELHIHYPVPPYLEGAYTSLDMPRGIFPITERLADEIFSLPIGFPADLDKVAEILLESLRAAKVRQR